MIGWLLAANLVLSLGLLVALGLLWRRRLGRLGARSIEGSLLPADAVREGERRILEAVSGSST